MGNHTTPEDQASLTFAPLAQTAPLDVVLRTCQADDALVAQFDRLSKLNLRPSGVPINVAVDRSSDRISTDFWPEEDARQARRSDRLGRRVRCRNGLPSYAQQILASYSIERPGS